MTDSPTQSTILSVELQRLATVEARLVRAAAARISAEQKQELTMLGALQMQSAKVGDIDINLETDRRIEHVIGLAAGMLEEAQAHAADKVAFKKAWRFSHTMRDAVPSVQMRIDQIACIVAGDGEGAADLTQAFFASVTNYGIKGE